MAATKPGLAWWLALVGLSGAFGAAYFLTFSSFEAFAWIGDLVGNADSNNYIRLLDQGRWLRFLSQDFVFDPNDRSVFGPLAQYKMILHVAYFVIGEPFVRLYEAVAPGGAALPYSSVFAYNATLGACSVLCVGAALITRLSGPVALLFASFYGSSLATWIYSSAPESWALSGLLSGLVLLLALREAPLSLVGAVVGIGMLNSITLASLLVLVIPRCVRETGPGWPLARRLINASLWAVGVWAGFLLLLSLWQPAYAPLHVLEVVQSFKSSLGWGKYSILSPVRWGYNAANMLVVSVVSSAAEPNFGRETLLSTARHFPIGSLGLLGYLLALGYTVFDQAHVAVRTVRTAGIWAWLSRDESGWALVIACGLGLGGLAQYFESFLYAPTLLPALTLLIAVSMAGRGARLERWPSAAAVLTFLVFSNTTYQVAHVRRALADPMSIRGAQPGLPLP